MASEEAKYEIVKSMRLEAVKFPDPMFVELAALSFALSCRESRPVRVITSVGTSDEKAALLPIDPDDLAPLKLANGRPETPTADAVPVTEEQMITAVQVTVFPTLV